MQYQALKPCTFSGKKYYKGDIIPDGVITDEKARGVIAMELVVPVSFSSAETFADSGIKIALTAYGAEVEFTDSEIVRAIGILQQQPSTAIESIKALDTDSNVFKLVHSVESRTNVKKAINTMLSSESGGNESDGIEDGGDEIID